MLPISQHSVRGANGTVWSTFLYIANAGDRPVVAPPQITNGAIPPGEVWRLPGLPPVPAPPGDFILYGNEDAGLLQFTLRLREETTGQETELPVVYESEARTGATFLMGVRSNGRERAMLRVYDFDSRDATQVRVRFYDPITRLDVAAEQMLTLTHSAALDPTGFMPGYAQLPLPQSDTEYVAEVIPITAGLRYWAFITSTDNVTQRVSIVTAR